MLLQHHTETLQRTNSWSYFRHIWPQVHLEINVSLLKTVNNNSTAYLFDAFCSSFGLMTPHKSKASIQAVTCLYIYIYHHIIAPSYRGQMLRNKRKRSISRSRRVSTTDSSSLNSVQRLVQTLFTGGAPAHIGQTGHEGFDFVRVKVPQVDRRNLFDPLVKIAASHSHLQLFLSLIEKGEFVENQCDRKHNYQDPSQDARGRC